jgi:hypothetical protein
MRRAFGFFWVVLTAILLATVGVIAYQAGWSEGFAQHVPEGTAAIAPYYGYYGPHFFGFGSFFGFLFILFILFLLFRVARFGRGGYGGWGRGGWGRGGYPGMGHGGGIPPAIDERMKEWHQRAHGEQPATPGQSSPPPPDQTQA